MPAYGGNAYSNSLAYNGNGYGGPAYGPRPPFAACFAMLAGTGATGVGFEIDEYGTFTPPNLGSILFISCQVTLAGDLIIRVRPDTGLEQDQFKFLEVDGNVVADTDDATFTVIDNDAQWLWPSGSHGAVFVDSVLYELCFSLAIGWDDNLIWDDNDIWDDVTGPNVIGI